MSYLGSFQWRMIEKLIPILIIKVEGRMATVFNDIFTTTTPRRAKVKMANSL